MQISDGSRLCGSGETFRGDESIDCTGCWEVQVELDGGTKVGISTRGPSAFRVRIIPAFGFDEVLTSPMVDPGSVNARHESSTDASGTVVTAYRSGTDEALGSITVTSSGTLVLKDGSGSVLAESGAIKQDATSLTLSTRNAQLYGRGASPLDADKLTAESVDPMVCNRATYVPYYYSTDGYSAMGVVRKSMKPPSGPDDAEGNPATHLPATYSSDGSHVTWTFQGAFELYLMPAATLAEGTQAYYQLTGRPAVPPRYAFGFIASRWGWKDRDDMESVMKRFRDGKFPLDAIVLDFEWFTEYQDYPFDSMGQATYSDFSYSEGMFPSPAEQLKEYRSDLHVRVGGIRKPRIGNSAMLSDLRGRGFIMDAAEQAGSYPPDLKKNYANGRNLDFSNPEVRSWYAKKLKHFYDDGMAFWWNDEGESDYFTFHWWNEAEVESSKSSKPMKRFFSLNRAFTPGMARLGAAVWTGDIDPTWGDLKGTPGLMLNWGLAGAPYVGCDIGGFDGPTNAPLLTRWMQMGVFMPLMRVHSVKDATPHWPWLFGSLAEAAMRKALELRMRLLPYHYSLAHAMHRTGAPWIRPLAMAFPDDAEAAEITAQWMDGDILVAPVVEEDNSKDVYLPAGVWYPFGEPQNLQADCGKVVSGPTRLKGHAVHDEIPAFARAGAIIPLAPVVQHTDALPGGPLLVQVYEGADGSFVLAEDDGETRGYQSGQLRSITFAWSQLGMRLSWTVSGSLLAPGPRAFTEMQAVLIDGSGELHSPVYKLGMVGSIDFGQMRSSGSTLNV